MKIIIERLKKIDWLEIQKDLIMGGCLVMVLSMCLSMWLIGTGYHGFDMGHNMRYVETMFNVSFADYGTNMITGQPTRTPTLEMIQRGSQQMTTGTIGLLVTSILFGVSIATLRYMRKE